MAGFFSKASGGLGALAGLGFGIYAATQNFNPDAHQAESMTEASRFLSELLTQIGIVTLQSGSLAMMGGVVGGIVDLLVECGSSCASNSYR